jgi:hypothetical protein
MRDVATVDRYHRQGDKDVRGTELAVDHGAPLEGRRERNWRSHHDRYLEPCGDADPVKLELCAVVGRTPAREEAATEAALLFLTHGP